MVSFARDQTWSHPRPSELKIKKTLSRDQVHLVLWFILHEFSRELHSCTCLGACPEPSSYHFATLASVSPCHILPCGWLIRCSTLWEILLLYLLPKTSHPSRTLTCYYWAVEILATFCLQFIPMLFRTVSVLYFHRVRSN